METTLNRRREISDCIKSQQTSPTAFFQPQCKHRSGIHLGQKQAAADPHSEPIADDHGHAHGRVGGLAALQGQGEEGPLRLLPQASASARLSVVRSAAVLVCLCACVCLCMCVCGRLGVCVRVWFCAPWCVYLCMHWHVFVRALVRLSVCVWACIRGPKWIHCTLAVLGSSCYFN